MTWKGEVWDGLIGYQGLGDGIGFWFSDTLDNDIDIFSQEFQVRACGIEDDTDSTRRTSKLI
jgi:hypothetical protein